MNLSHGEGRLNGSMKDFKHIWCRSEEQWQDQRRKEFAKEYVDEMDIIIKTASDSMAELSGILGTVINKCK
jgi:hypothetical protein